VEEEEEEEEGTPSRRILTGRKVQVEEGSSWGRVEEKEEGGREGGRTISMTSRVIPSWRKGR
jgi:hypothetical protein